MLIDQSPVASIHQSTMARRQALAWAAVAVGATAITACTSHDDNSAGSPPDGDAPTGEQSAAVLAKTSEVPVGSALIVDGVALTQQKPGEFTGLSTVCPHAGCAVSKVDGARLICPCHGSTFGLDGAVIKGPARQPLDPVAVTVRGDSIVAD